jgi:SAM-dependent methyltransferase
MSAPPDSVDEDLLDRIPLSARVLLDVGCGTGTLAAAYRHLNPRARLLGVERDAAAAAIAATRLDEVAVGDVEANPLPFQPEGGIDCIIYSDVLEHMKDPWAVLAAHAKAMNDDGVIIARIPNVEHWTFAERLLRGTWDYDPAGLMDRRHLRWFSLETMHRAIGKLGLIACDVHPLIVDADQSAAFANALAPSLRALGIDPKSYADRARPLQYIWRMRKTPRTVMHIAANMLAPVGGVSHVRVIYPLRAMASEPGVISQLTQIPDATPRDDGMARVFILHRPALSRDQTVEVVGKLHRAGWLVVTEFDDHPDFFTRIQGDDRLSFSAVHAVQTSTPVLADVLRPRNPELQIFPNAVRTLPDARNFVDPHRLTLFFGALNRAADWTPLLPTINAVASTAGERLRFSVVHDRAFFDALETPHKKFTPTCDYDTYLSLLGDSEISFMPLGDTWFNRAKSDLKFIEAGACRVAALASHVVYADSIEDGRTGLLFRDADDLHARLLRLVAMPDTARSLGDGARAYVRAKRMLAYQVAPRLAWYRSLWERRAELEQARLARIAEWGAAA